LREARPTLYDTGKENINMGNVIGMEFIHSR
jgi:hypothetical protein